MGLKIEKLLAGSTNGKDSGTRLRLPNRSWLGAWLLLAIPFGLILLFKYAPILVALNNSTQAYNLAGQPIRSIGLQHYIHIFSNDSFIHAIQLTLLFALVKIPLQLLLGFGSALFIFQDTRINRFVRSSFLLPTMTSIVVVGVTFGFLFDREIGIINTLLGAVGIGKVHWLLRPESAQFVVLMLSLWRDAGFVMLVFLTGLQNIPEQLLEAARLDGAGPWKLTWLVIFPLLRRTVQFATVFVTTATFQLFAPIFVLTKGGPQSATDVIAYHIYEAAFNFYDWGVANAMSIVVVVMLIVITLIEMRLLRTHWEY